jgi:hypothetical protein
MGTPFVGYGMQLSFLSSDAEVELHGLQSVQFGSDKVDTVDVTDTNAVNAAKVFIPGLHDSGDCTVVCNSLPEDTTQQALIALENPPASTTFSFVYPAAVGGSKTFTGIPVSHDESIPLDKEAKITFKIKISGAVATS